MKISYILKRALCAALCAITLITMLPAVRANAAGNSYAGITAKLDEVIKQYPDQSYWKSTFDGGSTCYGFAKLVVYNVFGKSTVPGKNYRSWLYDGTSSSGMNIVDSTTSLKSDSMKKLLQNARPGDVLQLDKGSKSRQHSIIIYSVAENGVMIYESNVPNYQTRFHFVGYDHWSGRDNRKAVLLRSDNYDEVNGSYSDSASEAEPVINLSQATYPSQTHRRGNNFGIRGIVSCNTEMITEVYGVIADENGYVLQSGVYHPNTYSHDLRYSINNDLLFGRLTAGNYIYYVRVTVGTGENAYSQVMVYHQFRVQ